jgi:hypothetical protein
MLRRLVSRFIAFCLRAALPPLARAFDARSGLQPAA